MTKDWTRFLQTNLMLDSVSMDTIPAGCYTVTIRFAIDKTGYITDLSVIKDPGFGLGAKVLAIVSHYKGRCEPARLDGKSVKSYRSQPITFVVDDEDEGYDEEGRPVPGI